jgi:ubiquinone/menaquinone biosynthesis C-methylase UbiE
MATPAAEVFAEIFDAFAADYERTRVPRFRPFVKKLLQLYDTRPKSWVLDAGTGTGLAATLVAPRVGHDGRVIGVDVSEKQLEIARQKAKNFGFTQCEFRIGDVKALDFPDGEFDLIICSFALQGEPASLFSEFRRVLKPVGGTLLCQDWTSTRAEPEAAYDGLFAGYRGAQPDERLSRFRTARAEDKRNWDPLGTPADYARRLNEVGFRQPQGHIEVITQHFENARAYVEWRGLETVHRVELEAMDPAKREQFLRAAEQVLRPFENDKGLDFDWSAIQVVART